MEGVGIPETIEESTLVIDSMSRRVRMLLTVEPWAVDLLSHSVMGKQ